MTDATTRVSIPITEHHLEVTRTARYVTAGGTGEVREVWIAIHGFGQLARRFARMCAPLAAPHRLVVVPEALNRYYIEPDASKSHEQTKVGATWMTREDRDAEIRDYVAYLDALYDATCAPHAATGAKVRVLGFSQGVATATRWFALGRAPTDQLVCWAGALPHDMDLVAHRARLGAADLVLVLGDRDEFATWAAIEAQELRLVQAEIPHRTMRFEGGHHLDADLLRRLAVD
jgi:dienelactone hydrolase